eukprot:353925-Chlamydomonas_euryale.AAC.10
MIWATGGFCVELWRWMVGAIASMGRSVHTHPPRTCLPLPYLLFIPCSYPKPTFCSYPVHTLNLPSVPVMPQLV